MADHELLQRDVQESVRFLQAFLEVQEPEVDWTPGSPDHAVVIKGQSYPVALLRRMIDGVRARQSLLNLRDAVETADVVDMADALLANLLVSRSQGKFSRGIAVVEFSRRVDQRVPRNARFFKGTALVYYPDYPDDLLVSASDMRVVRGADGAILHYSFPVNIKAARSGREYDQPEGPFDAVDPFSPHLLGATNYAPLTGGDNVQSTASAIDAAGDAIAARTLGSGRSNAVTLREVFGVEQTLTIGRGDPEMSRDRVSSSVGAFHIGGCADLYVRAPTRLLTTRKQIGASYARPDGVTSVFRDTSPPGGVSFTAVKVTPGDVLFISAGIPEAPVQHRVNAVRSTEVEISTRTPFSRPTDEGADPSIVYSIGNNYPDYNNKVTTSGVATTTADTSRALQADNKVVLSGGPVYRITKVELLSPIPSDLAGYTDPVTGRVPFRVRQNTPLLPATASTVLLPYRVEVLNPGESQSTRAVTVLEVGWPGLNLNGSTLEIEYETIAGFDTVAAYADSRDNPPAGGDYLIRSFHPVYVGFSVPYALRTDSSTASRIGRLLSTTPTFNAASATTDLVRFISNYRSLDPMDVSGLTTRLRFTNEGGLATVYAFRVVYDLLAPDGKVYRYETTDKVTIFPTVDDGAVLLNPVEVGLPATGYHTALKHQLARLGVSDRTIRYLVAPGAIGFTARA
jgi:hypothetical protein